MSTTLFVALQCFHCSTMQVKQQKKSSNKWVCVVCNQRQSVRKIHARSYLAKDLRKFVQGFNMSRMTQGSDGHRSISPRSEAEEHDSTIGGPSSSNRAKRRTDWTEYLDLQEEVEQEEDEDHGGALSEPEIVTELPKDMFKTPLVKYSPLGRTTAVEGNKPLKPNFSKRRANPIPQERSQSEKKSERTATAAKARSKWSEYLEGDSERVEEEEEARSAPTAPHQPWGANIQFSDTRVEEEVHPDFT